ncbi:MAG: fatty acyl-AMP ligase [Oculatellaceae cyanobacterium bins.114]|nr:fatty acyl-AMP ligase [Oculatellaceae cyanobacterium bins.114]
MELPWNAANHYQEACSNFVELLCYRALHQPDKTAFIFLRDGETESDRITYQELHVTAQAICSHLQFVTRSGERALLIYPPGLEFISAFFGCLYAGIVAVPVYPPRLNHNLTRLQHIIVDSTPDVALTTVALLENLKACSIQQTELSKLKFITTDHLPGQTLNSWCPPKLSNQSLAFLQYTSGSTGNPKGVMVSHGNLFHNATLMQQGIRVTSESIGVSWLPLYHDMGLMGAVLLPIYLGFPVTLMPPLTFIQNPYRWLRAISAYRATTSAGPNFAYDLCVQKVTTEQRDTLDLSCWTVAVNGGETVRSTTLENFAEKFQACGFRKEAFYPSYGMAEATLMISGGGKEAQPTLKEVQLEALEGNQCIPTNSANERSQVLVSCGKALLDQEIIIVHPATLIQCEDMEVGEIWLRGSSVAQGYWNQSQETNKIFDGRIVDSKADSFLRTGDLGFLEKGELYVTGRLKDIIIINGRNHYPQDIEQTVEQSHSTIRPAGSAAFSVSIEGVEQLVILTELERTCYLSLKQKNLTDHHPRNTAAESQNLLTANEIFQAIQRAVSRHHDLKIYKIILLKYGTLPKTSSGKVQRYFCKANFLSGKLEVVGYSEKF